MDLHIIIYILKFPVKFGEISQEVQHVIQPYRTVEPHAVSFDVSRVWPRTFKGITDLLLLCLVRQTG